jgi:hypothetical protein
MSYDQEAKNKQNMHIKEYQGVEEKRKSIDRTKSPSIVGITPQKVSCVWLNVFLAWVQP